MNFTKLGQITAIFLVFFTMITTPEKSGFSLPASAADKPAEADSLATQAAQLVQNRQYREAITIYLQLIEQRRSLGVSQEIADTTDKIANLYAKLEEYSKAIEFYHQSLAIYRKIEDKANIGSTLNTIGALNFLQGNYQDALTALQEALTLRRELGDSAGVARTLNNIGAVYRSLGKYPPALEVYQEALPMFREAGNRRGEAALLNNLGIIHNYLGQYDKALVSYEEALVLHRELGQKADEARTLHNMGLAYRWLKDYPKSLQFYRQALELRRQIGDKSGIAQTLNNLGLVLNEQTHYGEALSLLEEALKLVRELDDRAAMGRTIDSLGTVYQSLKQYDIALEHYQQALALEREVGDRESERFTLRNIGDVFHAQNQPEIAIIFYKQSVNVTEAIRQDLKTLSQEQQRSYTATVADTYRHLADLLLKQNRAAEAQQVLDLLKIQELQEYLHSVSGNEETAKGIELLPQEQQLLNDIAAIQNRAINQAEELAQLQQIPPAKRTAAQEQRRQELEANQEEIAAQFHQFITSPDVRAILEKLTWKTGGENIPIASWQTLQYRLQQLNQNAAILYPLVLPDRLELVLVTATAPPIHHSVPVSQQQLETAIHHFRETLTAPSRRFTPKAAKIAGEQLYQWLIKPIENDLNAAGVKTIIYAPDGQLRYIPLAALYDGNQWLIERYSINNITAASLTNFQHRRLDKIQIFAGAFTTGSYEFQVGEIDLVLSGLPGAGQEVANLAKLFPNTTTLIDESFNPQATLPRLNENNIVHLATHAGFLNGYPEDSFILLGDGSRLTLRDLDKLSLPNVELIVLSACQTGMGGVLGNGQEILGFGYQVQQTGAKASIASLWSVNDAGTQALMTVFYEALSSGKFTKTDALHQAQLALVTGNNVDSSLTHPYYWSAFIMIGNGF
ncbi:tetratricopeptide repeat protein [[Phormidium] sp. ETS-05]|uniref:CHAT domain-containing protein n=1 Tax=[Phormidium] sp. ETS-05 TaxID=222819 RepID=UPI0018EEE9DA|nr:tetratricopeptide repeat protein [[Phormidium] sp. ETS-05]